MEWLSIWSNLALLDSYFGYTSASMRENAPFPDLVAKVVLKAVKSENPEVFSWKGRRNMDGSQKKYV